MFLAALMFAATCVDWADSNSLALLQTTVSAVMFWSYIPLVSLVLTGIAFAVKMPIEVR